MTLGHGVTPPFRTDCGRYVAKRCPAGQAAHPGRLAGASYRMRDWMITGRTAHPCVALCARRLGDVRVAASWPASFAYDDRFGRIITAWARSGHFLIL
jgi:hypothetical protein